MATNGAPEPEPVHDAPHNIPLGGSGGPGSGGFMGIPTKWLIIGGGGIGGVALVAVVVAVLFLFVLGGGSPQPGSIMDLVPARADRVVILDIKAMLADDNLIDEFVLYDSILNGLEDIEVDRESVEQLVVVVDIGASALVVAKASFNSEDVQDALQDEDYDDDNYRGYTIWIDDDDAVVLLEGGYIVGGSERPVKAVLNSLYQSEGALSNADDNNELKRILNKLGRGIIVYADVSARCENYHSEMDRCEGYGTVLTEVDADGESGNFKYVALGNERFARNMAGEHYDILDDFFVENEDLDIDDAEADGEFVTGAGTRDWGGSSSSTPTAPAPVDLQATISAAALAAAIWVEDCAYNGGQSFEVCECLHDELEEILEGTGVEIPDYDSSGWRASDDFFFVPAREYAEEACF